MAKLAPHLKERNAVKSLPQVSTPRTDLFLKNFLDAYKNMPESRSSLAVACVRAVMAKASPVKNVYYDERLINLLRYLNDINGKCADVAAVNLAGHGKCWIQEPTDVIGQSVCTIAQKKWCKREYGTLFCIIA